MKLLSVRGSLDARERAIQAARAFVAGLTSHKPEAWARTVARDFAIAGGSSAEPDPFLRLARDVAGLHSAEALESSALQAIPAASQSRLFGLPLRAEHTVVLCQLRWRSSPQPAGMGLVLLSNPGSDSTVLRAFNPLPMLDWLEENREGPFAGPA